MRVSLSPGVRAGVRAGATGRAAVLIAAVALGGPGAAAGQEGRPLRPEDLYRMRTVADPRLSPDGEWVAYTVSRRDSARDRHDADVWMASWDGERRLRLTTDPENETAPRWSPDGRWLGFLSARGRDDGAAQLWLLPLAGGEAERVTDFPGGVVEYAWAPDGRRVTLVVRDPEEGDGPGTPAAAGDSTAVPGTGAASETAAASAEGPGPSSSSADREERPRPIVVDRFWFKEDGEGFLGDRRRHLWLLDVETREARVLTPGPYEERLPAWSPDGRRIAFVGKRHPDFDRDDDWNVFVIEADSGAVPRRLTDFAGPDGDPEFASPPAWSPDGTRIAYVRGGTPDEIWYGLWELAVVPATGGEPRVLTEGLDRNVWGPAWTPDGRSLLVVLEEERSVHLASMPAEGGEPRRLTGGRRYVGEFSAGPAGRVAMVSSTPDRPAEVFALSIGGPGARASAPRPLSRHNEGWLAGVRLAPVEEIDFQAPDGTRIGGFLVRPATGATGPHPTLLRLHGGPVWQFSNGFDFSWQLFAAHGYAVVAPNPRGSTGRGEAFQKAIFGDWGNLDVGDVLAAVDHAVAMGVADPERLGVGGWSYGGMLTDYVIASDDRFAAAVSGAGIGNMLAGYGHDRYVREWEAEVSRPWEDPEPWIRLSYPFFEAERIRTPTLFVCGQEDWNVPLIGSEQMYQALRSLGVETRLVIYPGEDHSIDRPSFEVDRLRRYLDWYGRFLLREAAAGAR